MISTDSASGPYLVVLFPVGSPSLSFSFHFPGGPGLAGTTVSPFWILLELRMMEMAVTTGTRLVAPLVTTTSDVSSDVASRHYFIIFYSLLFFIILLGTDPKCLLTSTDLQTRRARCQHQLSFLFSI